MKNFNNHVFNTDDPRNPSAAHPPPRAGEGSRTLQGKQTSATIKRIFIDMIINN